MILDLRRNGTLPTELAQAITRLEPVARQEYNDYIATLVSENALSGLTLLAQVTCRNTFISLLHDRLCRLKLLDQLLHEGVGIDRIVVDSPIFGGVVKRLCEKQARVIPVDVQGKDRTHALTLLLNVLKSLYLVSSSWLWPKLLHLQPAMPQTEVVLLDTFILSDSFDAAGNFKDRNYPGLEAVLRQEGCWDAFWYLPTLINVRSPSEFISRLKKIKKSSQQFLIRESFLTVSDYWFALKQSLAVPRRIQKIPQWNGLDISEIVLEELQLDQGSTGLVGSLLTYQFIRCLAKQGLKTRLIIDWHENQTIDRALSLAAKKYFPQCYVVGYQGYIVPDYYTCKDPTLLEMNAGTLPDEIGVVGKALVQGKKKYCAPLNVTTAPAFRFLHLFESRKNLAEAREEIVVALPIMIDMCKTIIDVCLQAVAIRPDLQFVLKIHPAYRLNDFLQKAPGAKSACFQVSEMRIERHLASARLLISAASSVCFEAVLMQVPVAIAGSHNGPAMNPLAEVFDAQFWEIVYDGVGVLKILDQERPAMPDLAAYIEDDVQGWIRQLLIQHTGVLGVMPESATCAK